MTTVTATKVRDVKRANGLYGKYSFWWATLYRVSPPVPFEYGETRYVILARTIPQVRPMSVTCYASNENGDKLAFEPIWRHNAEFFEWALEKAGWKYQGELALQETP